MLKHEDNTHLPTADEARVSTHDFTEALASIEIRKARQAFEQAGTLTLAEAAAECRVEATPEELWGEIECLRMAEAVQQKAKCRQRFLRFGLGAEIVSTALCLLVLLGMKHTEFSLDWHQTRQIKDFQQKLRQTTGLNPKYDIEVVPEGASYVSGSQTTVLASGDWLGRPAYPLYSLPDGYEIHTSESLDDEEHDAMMPPFLRPEAVYFEFRERGTASSRDNIFVYYNGLQYRRGWIRKHDISRVLQGHSFILYRSTTPGLVSTPEGLVPLTASMQSIVAARAQWTFMSNGDGTASQNVIVFPEGRRLQLDSHAWEQGPGSR